MKQLYIFTFVTISKYSDNKFFIFSKLESSTKSGYFGPLCDISYVKCGFFPMWIVAIKSVYFVENGYFYERPGYLKEGRLK